MEPRSQFKSKREGKPFGKRPFKKPGRPGERKGSGGGMRTQRKRVRRVLPPLDYKDTEMLTKYLTEKGKILPRRITRLNAKDQRVLTRVIKRARHSGLLPFQVG